MSLRKRYRLTPVVGRLNRSIETLPETFNANSQGEALRIINALDAAVDDVQRANRLIRKGIIDG